MTVKESCSNWRLDFSLLLSPGTEELSSTGLSVLGDRLQDDIT